MTGRRFDSLFARLMLAQALLFLLVGLLFAVWLTGARGEIAAAPYAQLWAGPLSEVAARPAGEAWQSQPGHPVRLRSDIPPDWWTPNLSRGPAGRRLAAELRANGVSTDDIRLGQRDGVFLVWLHLLLPGAAAVWLAVDLPPILPVFGVFTGAVILLTLAMMTAVVWAFARRMTRPLEQLRVRLAEDVQALATRTSSPLAAGSASAEIVAIDQAYHQLIARLQRSERERVLMLAGVSHDLRSPLGRIRLAAELLPVTPETAVDLATITDNVDHADRLIGSFVDFVSAGTLALDEAVDLVAVARAVLARFELPAETLALQVSAPAGLLLARANALLVDRLVFNLVDNALQHGGAPVRVQVSSAREGLEIDVCDAGPGLPAGREQGLLQAFARGDAGRLVPGLGLGLAVVVQTAERLGGRLRFSRDASGHHAIVTLPPR